MAELKIHSSEIRIEEPAEFEGSYFREEYTHIFRVIEGIVERTKENRKRERDNVGSYCPDIHIHNIVPIIGRRGSGKSTVMLSVAGVLEKGMKDDDEKVFPFFKPFCGERKPLYDKKFILLDCIDGSLLEPNEDIFQTILALMYQQFKSKVEPSRFGGRFEELDGERESIQYRWQRISKMFEKLYQNICLLDQDTASKEGIEDITPLSSLHQLSSSLKIRQDFRELLKNYLSLYSDTNKKSRPRGSYHDMDDYFLVIPIDDLDLNILHGHEMLEKIHRYLMLPNVIILMAFDPDQLCRLSEKFFYNMIPTFDSKMNDASPKILELARQYLEKVMPLDSRTYIPHFSLRVDASVELYDERTEVKRNRIEACQVEKNEEGTYSQKDLLFMLLCMKLGMRMDTNGVKRHFFLQQSLRSYVNFALLLKGMSQLSANSVMENWDQVEPSFRYNERILTLEIINRMVPERLSDSTHTYRYRADDASTTIVHGNQKLSDRKRFDRIINTQRPLPRAFKELIRVVIEEAADVSLNVLGRMPGDRSFDKERLQISNTYQGRLLDLAEELIYYGYSYGEVLYTIYEYGRLHSENKELIRCLLAYYSLKLTRSFLYFRYGTKEEKQQECENMMDTLGGSVSGGWTNRMVPAVYRFYQSAESAGETASSDASLMFESGCRVEVGLGYVLRLDSSLVNAFFPYSGADEIQIEKQLRDFIQSILLLGMFFSSPNNRSAGSLKWRMGNENKTVTETREMFKGSPMAASVEHNSYIQMADGKGVYNALGFVSAAFQWTCTLDEDISQSDKNRQEEEPVYLLDKICEYLNLRFANEAETLKNAVGRIKEGILQEFRDWGKAFGGFAIPVQDIDVCYIYSQAA